MKISHEDTKTRRREGTKFARNAASAFFITPSCPSTLFYLVGSRSQSPDWERPCVGNSVSSRGAHNESTVCPTKQSFAENCVPNREIGNEKKKLSSQSGNWEREEREGNSREMPLRYSSSCLRAFVPSCEPKTILLNRATVSFR